MTRRGFTCGMPVFLIATWASLCVAPEAHAVDFVEIQSPANGGTIPLAPGSVAVSGNKENAGTITVEIFATKVVDGQSVATGPALSSGATAVRGWVLDQSAWAVTLNSPAANANVLYALRAIYRDVDGNVDDVSDDVLVTSQ